MLEQRLWHVRHSPPGRPSGDEQISTQCYNHSPSITHILPLNRPHVGARSARSRLKRCRSIGCWPRPRVPLNFALRRFTLEPNGQTPQHSHPWEHEVHVLQGGGVVVTDAGETPLQPECAVLVLPDETHCFRSGEEGLQMLCLVPLGEATRGH